MTIRGFLIRLVVVALSTWTLGSIIESFAWGLYFALLPVLFWELLRPRAQRPVRQDQPSNPTSTELP